MTTYHLVTTPIYETWSKTTPNLLAGEWCKIYQDNNITKEFQHKIAEYHWDDRDKYFKNSIYLREIQAQALIVLTNALNEYHVVKHPTRFWQILIGPWLHKFIHIIFDKYETLSKINQRYKINNSSVLNLKSKNFIPPDTEIFATFMRNDLWHHFIFSKILVNFFNIKHSLIKFDKINNKSNTIFTNSQTKKSLTYNFLNECDHFSKKIFNSKNHDYFIKNSYLSIQDEIKLNFFLNKSLTLNFFTPKNKCYIENLNRDHFLGNLDKFDDRFFKVLLFMIREQLPLIFLECFSELNSCLEKLKWPHNPKKIFTANSYEFDEYFKLYSAKNIIKGSKLIIGQHGGFFGMGKWNLPEEHQINVSDSFISWGWKTKNKKVKEGFVFTKKPHNFLGYKGNNKAIFITHPVERYTCKTQAWPAGASQSYKFINEHIEFFKNLPKKIQKKFVFRILKKTDDLMRTNYIDRIKDTFLDIAIDYGDVKLSKSLNDCKLACIAYNSTIYLQTLSMNFPTVIFWNESNFELNESTKECFDKLKLAGIFHTNPISASNHINSIWSNIDSWWESAKVQDARKFFCNKYAKIKNNNNQELKKLIEQI